MIGQLISAAGLTATIAFVCWWFKPPSDAIGTAVSEECRLHHVRAAMRRGDDPNEV